MFRSLLMSPYKKLNVQEFTMQKKKSSKGPSVGKKKTPLTTYRPKIPLKNLTGKRGFLGQKDCSEV